MPRSRSSADAVDDTEDMAAVHELRRPEIFSTTGLQVHLLVYIQMAAPGLHMQIPAAPRCRTS